MLSEFLRNLGVGFVVAALFVIGCVVTVVPFMLATRLESGLPMLVYVPFVVYAVAGVGEIFREG